jgi:2-methylcitrate dehydratase PrpD
LPYCLGLAATLGEQALMPLGDGSLHHDQAVAFAKRVRVSEITEMSAKFPARAAARVHLETVSGRFSDEMENPWGEPDSGIGRAELAGKFHMLAEGIMPGSRVDTIISAVEDLRNIGVEPLIEVLGAPMAEQPIKPRAVVHV